MSYHTVCRSDGWYIVWEIDGAEVGPFTTEAGAKAEAEQQVKERSVMGRRVVKR